MEKWRRDVREVVDGLIGRIDEALQWSFDEPHRSFAEQLDFLRRSVANCNGVLRGSRNADEYVKGRLASFEQGVRDAWVKLVELQERLRGAEAEVAHLAQKVRTLSEE